MKPTYTISKEIADLCRAPPGVAMFGINPDRRSQADWVDPETLQSLKENGAWKA